MKSYNAIVYNRTKDPRFVDFEISLKSSVPVHPNTKLVWIEEIGEDATPEEREWYNNVMKVNYVGGVDE
jgi:hypothetical protein